MNWFNKDINRGHYFYIIIILCLVIIFLIATEYWSGDNAGVILNNIATVTSIILAVLAIIITLVDVAGQKEGLTDLKDSVREVKGVLDAAHQMNEENKQEMEKISNLRDELLERFEEHKIIQHTIQESIDKAQGDTINKKELKNILDENITDHYLDTLSKENYHNMVIAVGDSNSHKALKNKILKSLKSGQGYSINQINDIVNANKIHSIHHIRSVVKQLIRNRELDREKVNEEILYYLNDN